MPNMNSRNNITFKARVIAKNIIDDLGILDKWSGLGRWLEIPFPSDHEALIEFAKNYIRENPSMSEYEIMNDIKKLIPKQYCSN